VESSQ